MKTNPKDKAFELVGKIHSVMPYKNYEEAIDIATITAEEVINELFDGRQKATKTNNERIKFWQEVKKEIDKL